MKTIDTLIAEDKEHNELAYKKLKKIADQLEHGKFYKVSNSREFSYFQFDKLEKINISEGCLEVKTLKIIEEFRMGSSAYFRSYGKYKIEEIDEAHFESLRLSDAKLRKQRCELFEVPKMGKGN